MSMKALLRRTGSGTAHVQPHCRRQRYLPCCYVVLRYNEHKDNSVCYEEIAAPPRYNSLYTQRVPSCCPADVLTAIHTVIRHGTVSPSTRSACRAVRRQETEGRQRNGISRSLHVVAKPSPYVACSKTRRPPSSAGRAWLVADNARQ